MSTMRITINGQEKDVGEGCTIRSLVDSMGIGAQRLAVERNGEFLAFEQAMDQVLLPGDRIELVRFVGGG